MHDPVFLDEPHLDAIREKGMSEIGGSVSDRHGCALAEFRDDPDIQAGAGFVTQRVVECVDGRVETPADVKGQNPDSFAGRGNGFEARIAEGFGWEELHLGRIARSQHPGGETDNQTATLRISTFLLGGG